MIEYISKEKAVYAMLKTVLKAYSIECGVQNFIDSDDACKVLNDLPSADCAPVVHSRWEYKCGEVCCPECGNRIHRIDLSGYLNFCPNCGARMDEKGEK